nr:phosphotransferase [Halovenus rubra]
MTVQESDRVDDEYIGRIAETELGARLASISTVPEGLLHETYELEYEDEAYVLQVSPAGERRNELRRGLQLYQHLQDSRIPVPDVVTEQIRDHDSDTYSIVEKLPGESAKDNISPERVLAAGRYLARIHDTWTFETTGWIGFEDEDLTVRQFEEGTQRRQIVERVRQYSTLLEQNGLEPAGKRVANLVDPLKEDLPGGGSPVLCHNDYSPDNILYRDNEITGILDFDRAIAGHGRRDLVKAANAFWMHDPCVDWEVREKFYDGYREIRSLDDRFADSEPLFRVETLTEIVGGMVELGELSEYEAEFYTEQILEAVGRLDL